MSDGFKEWWDAAGAQRRWEWARDASVELRDFRALGMWSCNACGPHVRSRANWCERGCGRDYNKMTWVAEGQTVADLKAENEQLRAELATSPPIQGEPCPTKECPSDLDHDGMLLFLYAHFAGTEFDGSELFCPRCGQPLSSPVKEET